MVRPSPTRRIRAWEFTMQSILSLTLEFVFVAAVVSIIQLLVLVFRNPHRPQWLRQSLAESVAVIGIVMGLTLSMASLVAGLVGAGGSVFVSLILTFAVPFAVALVNERLFHLRERLRRADSGGRPLRRLRKLSSPPIPPNAA
jgi:predicted Na+-dependent transporter